ncbi:hypothetical protein LZ30DRAFT_578901 [Colletotrichum cereale]|nr:hypothetical protein LZ30DRAFT_578901 [Colletotrichum cereale]
MSNEHSPDPLQDSGSDHPLESGTTSESSISGVGSQRGLLSQLETSQPITTCVFRDEKSNQHVQSDKPDDKHFLEAKESFFFAAQPKHKPNQFSGRQKQLNIDFETLEAPKGETVRLVVDTPPPESVPPLQWASPKDSRDHRHKIAGPQMISSYSHIHQRKQSQSITNNRDPNSVQPGLKHVSNRAGMPTQHISNRMDPPFEHHPAVGEVSESRRISIDHPLGFAMEGRLNGRPFADADASFPGFRQIPAQISGQSPVVGKSTVSCLTSPRGATNDMVKRAHASDQIMETMVSAKTPQSHNGNTFERAKHEQQCHTPRYNKPHLKANVYLLPASNDGAALLNSSRFDLSDTRKNENLFLGEQFHGKELGSKSEADRRYGQPHKQNSVQKSHFDVLQSMITHHNMFLEDAKLTEENLKTEIAGHERALESFKTHMERSHQRHQQEEEHRKTLNNELFLLRQEKDESIAIMAQRDGREQELGAEVAKLRALGEIHVAETSELKNKLAETQSKLNKLQEKGRGYKDHLNKAIAEHQELWQQSKDISQKVINDMRKEHQESEEQFRSALDEKQAAQDKLNRIFNDKRTALQQELNAAASNTKSLVSAMEKLGCDLLAEADKTKGLEEQLSKSKDRETFLLRVEENIGQISDKLNEMHVRSVQANIAPISIMERLDEITAYVQSAPQADLGDEIRQALNDFQRGIIGRSTIEDRLQSLEKTVQDQAVLAQTERQKQQEQLLRQISEKEKENQDNSQTLQSKNDQMSEVSNAVSELAGKLQELKASVVLASQNRTTSEAEIRLLQELLLNRDHQVSDIQAELKLQHEGHEVTLRELRQRLLQAGEDARQKSEVVGDSQCKETAMEDGFAAEAQEKKTELELQLRDSEDSRQNIQQRLSDSEAEIKRLKTLGDNSDVPNLRKELNDANQRIINLTLKLRETQTPAVEAEVLDQLAEQLAQLNSIKEDIRQLKTSGKTYTTVSKELVTLLGEQDAARDDDIQVPDSLVVPEPDLPDLQQGATVNPLTLFEFTSSETALVQSGKKTVFRRPVEEPYQEMPVPSVAQEKIHRRVPRSHGPHPKPILRPQRMTTGSLNVSREPLVTRHAGHSSYNRPVQGASMTGQTAISDVRSNLLCNRKIQISDLTSHGDWQKMTAHESQGIQQGTKRGRSLPASSQRPKRSKTSFPVDDDNNDNGSSVAGERNTVNSQQIESSQQTELDYIQSSQGRSQDNDHTSRHFHQSTHKPGADSICRGNVGDYIDLQQNQQPAKMRSSTGDRKESLRSAVPA